jgi:hypothetical protein
MQDQPNARIVDVTGDRLVEFHILQKSLFSVAHKCPSKLRKKPYNVLIVLSRFISLSIPVCRGNAISTPASRRKPHASPPSVPHPHDITSFFLFLLILCLQQCNVASLSQHLRKDLFESPALVFVARSRSPSTHSSRHTGGRRKTRRTISRHSQALEVRRLLYIKHSLHLELLHLLLAVQQTNRPSISSELSSESLAIETI